MRFLAVILALLVALMVSVNAQTVRINHMPLTYEDIRPYLPSEMAAQLDKWTPAQQKEWAWKETDRMIAKGIIKKTTTYEPWSESIAKAANDMVPGADKVVRQVTQDVKETKQAAKEFANNPSVHNAAKVVKEATDIPINAQAGTAQVLKDNAGKALDKRGLGGLKPIVNAGIGAAVNAAVPIPKPIGMANKISSVVEKHTDENDHVLICQVNPGGAPAASAPKGKSFLEVSTGAFQASQAEAEDFLAQSPNHSCGWVAKKHLAKSGIKAPPADTKPARGALKKLSAKQLKAAKAKVLAPKTPAKATKTWAPPKTHAPEVANALRGYADNRYKKNPIFSGPLARLNAYAHSGKAKPAAKTAAKPAAKPAKTIAKKKF